MSLVGNASPRLDLIVDMNHRLGSRSAFEDPFNPRVVQYMETNLIDLDDLTDLEATSVDPKEVRSEIGILKKWVAKEKTKWIHLEKEKEQATLDTTIERGNLLRRMDALKEQNKKLEERTLVLHANVFGDIDTLRSKVLE